MTTLNTSEVESKSIVPVSPSALLPQEPLSPKSLNEQAQEFVHLVNLGIESWAKAGRLLVSMRQQDQQIFRKIVALAPWITGDILVNFCRMGEGRLYPQVLLMPHCPAWAEIVTAPFETQERICNESVEVVTSVKNNEPVTQRFWARELDKKSTALVFKNGLIRSVEAQVAVLKTQQIVPAKLWSPAPTKPAVEEPKMNPIITPTVLVSIGCYIVGFDGDRPFLVKRDGTPLAATQTVIVKMDSSNTLGAMIEFKKWRMK